MADDSSSSSASYIRMVQHLIEECILFNLEMEECMEALSKHANVKPVITSTVWKELEKENKDFFEAYGRSKEEEKRAREEDPLKLASTSGQKKIILTTDSSSFRCEH